MRDKKRVKRGPTFQEKKRIITLISLITLLLLIFILPQKNPSNYEEFTSKNPSFYNISNFPFQGLEIIPITDAIELDKNRKEIKNIFERVNSLDNIWEEIPSENYARVTFEKNLTSKNDIRLYAKSSNKNPVDVEVYRKESNLPIALFPNILEENFYRVLLTNLSEQEDTFDLRITGGNILIDYIVDPFAAGISKVAQLYQTGFNDDVDTETSHRFDQTTVLDDEFSNPSNTQLQVNEEGIYKISYGCQVRVLGSSNRRIVETWLDDDSVELEPSRTFCYVRQTGDDGDRCSNQGVVIANLSIYSNLTVQTATTGSGTGSDITTEESCWIFAEQVTNPVAQIYETSNQDNQLDLVTQFNQDFDEFTYSDNETFIPDVANSRIAVREAGLYRVYYAASSEKIVGTSDTERFSPTTYIYLDDSTPYYPSQAYSYHKRVDQANRSTEQAATIINLTEYQNISLRRFLASGDTLNQPWSRRESWLFVEKLHTEDVLFMQDSSGGQATEGSDSFDINVTFDKVNIVGPNYTYTAGNEEFYINESGLYEVSYVLGWDDAGNGGRFVGCARLTRAGVPIEPSEQCDYSRGDAEARYNSVFGSFLINNTAGDNYVFQWGGDDHSESLEPNATWIMVVPVPLPDVTPPLVTIASPLEGEFLNSLPVSFSVETNEESTVNYSLNGGSNTTLTANSSGTGHTNSESLSDGVYTMRVYAQDQSENINHSESITFTLDTIDPFVFIDLPDNETYNNLTRPLNFSATDTNLDSCWYSDNDGQTNNTISSCANTTYLATEGQTELILWANDSAGNLNSSRVLFFADEVIPLINFSSDSYENSSSITGTSIYVNVTVVENNEVNITFNLYNSTGQNIRSTFFTNPTRSLTWTLLAEDSYRYNVTIFDKASNTNTTETRFISLDDTVPLIDYTNPTRINRYNSSNNWIYVNVSVTEVNEENITFYLYNGSGLINETTSTSGLRELNFTGLADGTYEYNVTIFDEASFENTTTTREITIDTINPLVSYISPTPDNETTISNVDFFRINVSITEENVQEAIFSIYTETTLRNQTIFTDGRSEIIFNLLPDNIYKYNVTINDFAGNTNSTLTRFVTIDRTGPVINIISPEPITYTFNESLPLNHTVSDTLSTVDSCWWNLDNGPNTTIACNTNTTFNATNGPHTIEFYANDSEGNIAREEVDFLVAIFGPATVLVDPKNDTFYSSQGDIYFNWTASSPAGISQCVLYGDWDGGWGEKFTYKEDWWDTNYSYRNNLNITAVSAVNDTYTVDIVIDTTGDRFLDNASDLRVVHYNGTIFTELDRLIFFPNTTTTRVQFQLVGNLSENESEANYSFYYGNPAAGNPPENNSNIWFFYDDFSQGNLDQWAYSTGTVQINTTYENPWTGLNSTLQVGSCSSAITKVNSTFFPPVRDLKLRALWLDNPQNICTGGSPDADGIIGLRGSDSTTYDGLLVEWDTDTGFHYDLGGTGSVPGDFIEFDRWLWVENYAYGTSPSTHRGKKWFFNETEPDTFSLIPSAITATSPGVPYLRVASGTAIVGAVFASVLVETEPTVTIQDENWNATVPINIAEDGNFQWNVLCTDNQDLGEFALFNLTFGIDQNNPLMNYTSPTLANDSNVSQNYIYVNVSTLEPNEENITFYLYNGTRHLINSQTYTDGTHFFNFTPLAGGRYFYNVTIFDKSSRENTTETRWIYLDYDAPLINQTSPDNNFFSNNFTQNFTADLLDGTELLEATLYIFNSTGALIFNATQPLVGLTSATIGLIYTFLYDDVFSWFFEAEDFAGNINQTQNRTITIDTLDPELTFFSPTEANDTAFRRNWITVNISIDELHFQNLTFSLYRDQTFVQDNSFTDGTRLLNYTLLSDNTYQYNVTSYDKASNMNISETRFIILDNVAPVIDFTSSNPINYYNSSLDYFFANITINETNEANITYTLYHRSNRTIVNETVANPGQYELNFSNLTDGVYTYNVTIIDRVSYQDVTELRTITIDTTNPGIEFVSSTEANATFKDQNWIFANVSVTELNEQNITFRLYNSTGLIDETTYTDGTREINWTNLQFNNVTYTYNVTVFDYSSNSNSTETRHLNLSDLTAPSLEIVNPKNQTYTDNESIPFNYIVIDQYLDSCWYTIDGGAANLLSGCGNTTLSLADEQTYNLTLFANDSYNQTRSSTITFSVNTSAVDQPWYIDRGTVSVDGTATATLNITFDPSKSFILHTARSGDSGPDSLHVMSDFVDSETIEFENYAAGGGAIVEYEVVGGPGISVTRGTVAYDTVDSTIVVDANSVYNLSSSFLVISTRQNDPDGADNGEGFWRGRFLNTTHIELNRGDTGTAGEISWQAVEWTRAKVQNGSFSASATTGSVDLGETLSSTSNSFVIFSHTASSSTALDYTRIGGYLENTTRIEFYRQDTNAGSMFADWFVVESPVFSVRRGNVDVSSAEINQAYSSVSNLSKTFSTYKWDSTGSGTTFANSVVAARLTSNANIELIPGTGSGNIKDVAWQVIEIESNPPILTINDPQPITYQNSEITFNITSNEWVTCLYSYDGGNTNYTLDYEFGFTYSDTNSSMPQGDFTVNFFCDDDAGNINHGESVTFGIDSLNPLISIDHPRNITYDTNSLWINYSVFDINQDSCWFSNDSGTTNYSLSGCNNNTYLASQGPTTLYVFTNDTAGNENNSRVTFFVDSIFPLINFSSDAYPNASYVAGTSVYTNVTVTEINEENITFSLYNRTNLVRQNIFTDGTRSLTWTLVPEGNYTLNVTIIDKAYNINHTENRTFVLDNSPPVVSYAAPTFSNWVNVSNNWIYTSISVTELYEANVTFSLYFENGTLLNETTLAAGSRNFNWTNLPDEFYVYNISVTDEAGQTGSTGPRYQGLDTLLPLVEFVAPTEDNDTVFNRDWIYANVTASDLNEANVTFELYNSSGRVNITIQNAGGRQINFTGLADGLYEYNVTLTDSAFNKNTTKRTIAMDNTGPNTTIHHPRPITYGINTSLPLNTTTEDEFSGLDTCWYNLDNGPNTTVACNVNTTFDVGPDATYTLYYYSNDTFGNLGLSTRTFSVSTAGPAITLNTPLNDTIFGTAPVEFNFTYTPTDPDGVLYCGLYGTWNGGWHLNQTDFNIENTSVNFFVLNITTEGNYEWNIECNDSLAQYEFSLFNFTIGLDLTNPLINFTSPTEVNDSNNSQDYVFANVSISDINYLNLTHFIYNETYFLVSNQTTTSSISTVNFSSLSDGRYYYNATTYDKASNVNSTETRTILLDTQAPDANLTAPVNNSFTNNGTFSNFTLESEDNNELLNATLFIFNSSGDLVYNATQSLVGLTSASFGLIYTFLYDDIYQWFYEVIDFVGNTFQTENRTITVDTLLPGVNFITPTESNDTAFRRNWIFANVTINETYYENITFALYRNHVPLFENTFTDSTREINWTLLIDETYQYVVSTFDSASNENITEERWIILDNVAPEIAFTSSNNQNFANISTNYLIANITINETNEANITYSLYNDSGLVNETTMSAGTYTFNWSGLADATYTYNVTVTDRVYFQDTTESRNITIDTTIPLVNFIGPTEANNTQRERNWIFANTSVVEDFEANITFSIFNSSGEINSTTYFDPRRETNWTNLASGNITYEYNVTVTDYSGNTNSSETRRITLIDLTLPLLEILDPQARNYTNNNSVPLDYYAFDLNKDTCWYNLDGGSNITLPNCQNTTLALADEQTYTLNLYVNDSLNQVSSQSVVFSTNTSLIIVEGWKVQRGTEFGVDGTSTVNIDDETYPTKSFILHTQRGTDPGPDTLFVQSNFVDENTIEFENYATGEGAQVEWEVITGPDLEVTRGTESYGGLTNNINVSLSRSYNLSSSFIIVTSRGNSGAESENQDHNWAARFVNETFIELRRGVVSSEGEVSWQAVEWTGANVQSGGVSASVTDTVANLDNPVNLSNSFLIFSHTTTSGNTIQNNEIGGYQMNDSALQFYRFADDTGSMITEWFVIEAPIIESQRGSFLLDDTTTPVDTTINQLYNTSRSFIRPSWDAEGTGTTYSNSIAAAEITSTTNIRTTAGTTAVNDKNVSWQAIEIIERTPPVINLAYPINFQNITGYSIDFFNYSIEDESTVLNCSLWGNWTGWSLNQTITSPEKEVALNFTGITSPGDGLYIWNIECTDQYFNKGYNSTNYTFGTFNFPDAPFEFFNISQDTNDGTGNVTLYWNTSNHSSFYEIYFAPNLSIPFVYLNTTIELNYTDRTFSGEKRRFYKVGGANPVGFNNSSIHYGVHLYELEHNVTTRNRIGFPSNFSYLVYANDSKNEITNATAFTMFNETIQRRVTCNDFSCPTGPSCTDTNCNFALENGRGYEVDINSSAPTQINWSGVGIVHEVIDIQLNKNATDFGKNWISVHANTSLSNAEDLFYNITTADAVSRWDSTLQTSQGLVFIPFFGGIFVGTNFDITMEEGYEVSVNASELWQQTTAA